MILKRVSEGKFAVVVAVFPLLEEDFSNDTEKNLHRNKDAEGVELTT